MGFNRVRVRARINALRAIVPRTAQARLGWGVADQAVSSITNLALGIIAARSLDAASFGAFGLAWVASGVILNVSRGLATDPLTVRHSGPPDDHWRLATRRAASTATALGVGVGILCVVIGLIISDFMVAFGVGGTRADPTRATSPGQLAYRLLRSWDGQTCFRKRHGLGGCLGSGHPHRQPRTHDVRIRAGRGWAAARTAALFGCGQTRFVPRATGVAIWIRDHRDLGPRYLVENVSDSASAQLQTYAVGAIAGLSEVGALRGARILLAPVVALRMGISLIAVPEAARVLKRWPRHLQAFCLVLGGSEATACLLWGAVLLILPARIGELMLGSVWSSASLLIVPTTLAVAAGAMFDGAAVGLRALGASRGSMRVRMRRAVAWVIGGVVGALLAGAAGSVWGTVGANLLGVALVWWQLALARPAMGIVNSDSETAASDQLN